MRGYGVKKHDKKNGYMILQVRKGVHEMVMSVMPLITKIADKSCQLNIIHLSGTLRGTLKSLRKDHIMSLRATIGKQISEEASRISSAATSR